MIDPKKELFVWGPIDGRPIYISYFVIATANNMPKLYRYKWPEILFYFIKDKMTFISDYSDLRAVGKKHFNTWLIDDKNLKKVENDYKKAVYKLTNFQTKISSRFLSSLNNKLLAVVYDKWQKLYLDFWAVGLVPEMANWGGEQILKEILHEKIKNEKDFITAFEKLSAPERLSFYQEEELELLNLKKYEKTKDFDNLLEKHAQKYFWIRNSYFEQKELKEDYFKKILSGIPQVDARIKEIKNFPKKVISEKKSIIKKYKLNKKIIKTAKRLSYSIWWQDARKKQIFTSNYFIDLFLKEISKRKKISFLDLKFYWPIEISKLLKNNEKTSDKKISQRKKFVLVHYYKDILTYRTGEKERAIVEPFLVKKIEKTGIIKGMVVSIGCGKVKGKVKILLTPRNVSKMNKGDILVAPMTSPDYIVAMKKAAAVITDEGGITSHAAIVSRELKIPCIVGTKIATKVLKDNDLVEVDARKGIVKKIK